jgi:hypothetical protein
MSERVAVRDEVSRSATTKPLDERIHQYQSIGWTLRSGTGIVISQLAPLDLLWGNATKKMTAPISFCWFSARPLVGSNQNNHLSAKRASGIAALGQTDPCRNPLGLDTPDKIKPAENEGPACAGPSDFNSGPHLSPDLTIAFRRLCTILPGGRGTTPNEVQAAKQQPKIHTESPGSSGQNCYP